MVQNSPRKPLEPLSARAIGIFFIMYGHGSYMTTDELMRCVKEGRDAVRSALEELRQHGLVKTEKQKVAGGRFFTVSKLIMPKNRPLENRRLKSRPLIQLNLYKLISNIKNNFITNSSSSKELYNLKNLSAFADKEKYEVFNIPAGGNMSDYDDYRANLEDDRKMWDKERQEEFEEKKRKAHKKVRDSGRNVNGMVAEFASRVKAKWDADEWTQDKKNFIVAYANARRTHKTNGNIEYKMMDLYFGSLDHVGGITDPNHLWRRFITMWGPLSIQVKNTMLTPDQIDREEQREARSAEKLFDV